MKEIKYLPLKKLKLLEEGFGWLSNYLPCEDEIHQVGENVDEKDIINTELLIELGKLNKRRIEILEKFMK